jgi:hypothetical protein
MRVKTEHDIARKGIVDEKGSPRQRSDRLKKGPHPPLIGPIALWTGAGVPLSRGVQAGGVLAGAAVQAAGTEPHRRHEPPHEALPLRAG